LDSCKRGLELPDFSVDNFDSNPQSPTYSANITNPYMPLEVGKIFTYEPVPNPDNVVNTVIVMDIIHTITVGGKKQMPVFKGQRFIST